MTKRGYTITHVIKHAECYGEYKVGTGNSAYYTSCEDDARATAKHMYGQDIEVTIKKATLDEEDNW